MSKPVYVLSSDGHNFPSVYEFRDMEHAIETGRKVLDVQQEELEYLLEDGYLTSDDSGDMLWVIDSPTLDVTVVK